MIQKNIYAGSKTILKDAIPLNVPLCISIEPTNLCNFKCAMCFHGNNEDAPEAKPLKNMDEDVFSKTLGDIKTWVDKSGEKIKLIKLYSLGEPFVNPVACEMVKRIKTANICEKVEITTNGSLMTKEVAEKLVDYGLDVLRLSVYSVTDDRLKEITKSKVSPSVIENNLEYLRLYRDAKGMSVPRIYAKMLDSNTDENVLFQNIYKSIADEVGIDEVFQVSLGEGNDAFERMYASKAEEAHQKSLASNTVSNEERRPCRYPFSHMTIRNDGTVIVCCADWLKELSIGNVMEHSLEEIWESKSLYNTRCDMLRTKGLKWTACRNCEIPYRDSPEDDVSDVNPEVLSYRFDI